MYICIDWYVGNGYIISDNDKNANVKKQDFRSNNNIEFVKNTDKMRSII